MTGMSVLGESHLATFTDMRSSLLGGGAGLYPPGLPGLGHSSLLPLPLWRPSANPLPPVWCNLVNCPCNLSRPGYFPSDISDYVVPPSWEASTWPSWYLKLAGDPIYKRNHHDSQDSPSKELPSKMLKQDRLKDRQELPQALSFSRDQVNKYNKSRCISTQTQIPHVAERDLPPVYMNGEMRHAVSSVDSYRHVMRSQSGVPVHERGSPPPYRVPTETLDAPLNLSLTSSSSSAFTPQVSRPSVITCASTVDKSHRYGNNSPSQHSLPSPSRREVVSVGHCDPIEEHFRRSLGKHYPDYMAPKMSPVTPPMADSPPAVASTVATAAKSAKPNTSAVSITGSVDDHFAKSLGNSTWSAIKAKNDPKQEMLPGTVDDHFAKALGGETWQRIKAEKESSPALCRPNGSSSPPSSSPHRRGSSPLRHDLVSI
ncbi:uncharacterized protein [Argopecten irradians]|uniref:uncharacterized protein isoform X1 n=1 Tax=Argopecten irradians TaxID=31199 RepID=UPI00371463B1